ncbi:MAG: DUF2339 domain-containing protein [Balneolaceae bacterium]
MTSSDPLIQQLLKRLDELQNKQQQFSDEIEKIREDIKLLQGNDVGSTDQFVQADPVKTEEISTLKTESESVAENQEINGINSGSRFSRFFDSNDIEKFIGENLINKIGILITIIGVAIGARYAIDHELISPAKRVLLGYMAGSILLFFAVRLRNNLQNFSAVLFSGAMAVFYIITFAAFSFYSLIASVPAFLLMVFITLITVAASLFYNRQVVAHIGLVGAYAVPFLAGGEGSISNLFLYMAIINAGVLSVAVYKYWKPLTISAFAFTWLIFGAWYSMEYSISEHFIPALIYSFLFFLIIYLAAIAYKLIREQEFRRTDIWLILANSFVFYGFGYSILSGHQDGSGWLGEFTFGNALVHFLAAALVYRSGLSDKNLFYLTIGLGVTFMTMAIPVELEGNWVTMLWTAEAALLFWIGRSQQITFYEKMSHPILALALISLLIDWNSAYPLNRMEYAESSFLFLINIHFFTSLFFIASLSFIVWTDFQKKNRPVLYGNDAINKLVRQMIWLTLIVAVYFAIRLEILGFFRNLFIDSKISVSGETQPGILDTGNRDLLRIGSIWTLNYTMLFVSMLSLAALRWLKWKDIATILFSVIIICTVIYLDKGLFEMGMLKDHYMNPDLNEPFEAGIWHIGIRYISFAFLGMMLYTGGLLIKQKIVNGSLYILYEALICVTLLWILSNELIFWLETASVSQPGKLWLTIFWGVYALLIVAIGIKYGKKHLRIGAIILLGIILIKLFFFDISQLDAIAKTIVFVALGVLLLTASFLYNKYKMKME